MRISLRTISLCVASAGCFLFFVLFVVFVSLYATTDRGGDAGGWDLSGPATCTPTSVTFKANKMFMWKTYPLKPDVESVPNDIVPQGFVGRNLVGHKHDVYHEYFSAKIRSISGRTVMLEDVVGTPLVNDTCYVTIDDCDD